MNPPIVCIGLPAWEGDYLKSTVQLMTEMARDYPVLYVEYPFTLKDLLSGTLRKGNIPVDRMTGRSPRLRKIRMPNGADVHVLTLPPFLPVNFIKSPYWYDLVSSWNSRIALGAIRKAMKQLSMKQPVVINAFQPFLGLPLAGKLDESLLIYYCYDEISAAKWAGRHGARLEKAFIPLTDGLIVSSEGLRKNKQALHKEIHLVKNGVDFDFFSKGVPVEKRPDFQHQFPGKKVAGYLGSVDERLDYDLLEGMISLAPQWVFVFAGRITDEEGRTRLARHEQVFLAGSQPVADLPGWVQSFDACMIPFRKNALTAGIYPLKINEYLACGKPVVTTSFADLSDFEGLVFRAEKADTFVAMLEKAGHPPTPAEIQERQDFASMNSWSGRAKQFGFHIQAMLKNQHSFPKKEGIRPKN